ncbi:Basic-leucine zipper domain [Dillenia turbinata]|uniref:Basic-leucine zipper domain n=1 Tax=Dillenia turbinata TaxID=194707 RepID=A0AAN8W163_9MAGN
MAEHSTSQVEPIPNNSLDQNPNFHTEDLDGLPIPPLDANFLIDDTFIADFDFDNDFDFSIYDFDLSAQPSIDSDHNLAADRSPSESGSCPGFADRSPGNQAPSSSDCSGDCHSAVLQSMNSSSPESGTADRDDPRLVDSSRPFKFEANSPNAVVDDHVNDMVAKNSISKRKVEVDIGDSETRSQKFRRSNESDINCGNLNPESGVRKGIIDEEKKRKARLMRNRESAQLSRQRRKHYVEELEDKVRSMHSTITDLNAKISYLMAENASLRQQLSSGGMCPVPPQGMYPHAPMAPMAYPWVPCAPYVVKSQGSQVPLVPIPRLRQQQPVSATKVKKTENKKSEVKSKKIPGVSFLGLLLFIFILSGIHMVTNKYGGVEDTVLSASYQNQTGFHDPTNGRVFLVNGHHSGSDPDTVVGFENGGPVDTPNGFDYRIHSEKRRFGGEDSKDENKQGSPSFAGSDEFVRKDNSSEPLVASLYVPRNDKLVKIDGNLIIHSVLASEKAMASHAAPKAKNIGESGLPSNVASGLKKTGENSLAIAGHLPPALVSQVRQNQMRHSPLYRNPTEQQRALSSGARDTSKSTTADGKLQEWFHEGLAGPILSSGMCTEVFQFDVSPASDSGAIVPAKPVTNFTEQQESSTKLNKGRNRRTLYGLPVHLAASARNITQEHVDINAQKDSFQGNKSLSSMIVSILVDPREAYDIEVDGVGRRKSLSRIFVVVLLDCVKYVTYSCALPLKGVGPHLVTA